MAVAAVPAVLASLVVVLATVWLPGVVVAVVEAVPVVEVPEVVEVQVPPTRSQRHSGYAGQRPLVPVPEPCSCWAGSPAVAPFRCPHKSDQNVILQQNKTKQNK